MRAREAARRLCASEAELVASVCGTSAVRLDPDFGALVASLPALGEVMALTRNEHAVHERTGRYENLQIGAAFGLVLGPEIDLRLFLQRWRYGFAVTETGQHGSRRSLQFFDTHGTALHKATSRTGAMSRLTSGSSRRAAVPTSHSGSRCNPRRSERRRPWTGPCCAAPGAPSGTP
ncbi:MAG: hypothetical protein LC647_05825, partial [Beggiatoa sp.]|nr:hypothetical protein [Beggiatoa sp.]